MPWRILRQVQAAKAAQLQRQQEIRVGEAQNGSNGGDELKQD